MPQVRDPDGAAHSGSGATTIEVIQHPTTLARTRTRAATVFASYDSALCRALAWSTDDARRASAILILLCLVLFLPGVFSRPPIDRTEVYYAQSARGMIERGDWLVPRDQNGVIAGRPVGMLWLQGLSAGLLGPKTHDAIWAYRLPSVVGATLAVLFLFLGMRPLIGAGAAFCASVLLAHTLLLAVQARLALPQSMALAAAVVIQTSLARLYLTRESPLDGPRRRVALTFWSALGAAILLNSLIVPIVALLTVAGLYVQDRNLKWLQGAMPPLGLLLGLLIALPGPLSLWLSITGDPHPDPDRTLIMWLSIMVDAQAMKHKAFPGSFLLTAWLAFLPCLLLLDRSCLMMWRHRTTPLVRFLAAWLLPYLAVMELLSHKPPLYMLQYVLPVLAVAIALRITENTVTGPPDPVSLPAPMLVLWAALGACLAAAPLVLQRWLGEPLTPLMLIASLVVVVGFAATAVSWRHCRPLAAISFSLAGAAVFYWLITALILPTRTSAWPSVDLAELRHAMRACYPKSTIIAGYSEPSAVFLIRGDIVLAQGSDVPRFLAERPGSLAVVDLSEASRLTESLRAGAEPPVEVACVTGNNLFTGRGNTLLRIYAKAPLSTDPACAPPARYRCPVPSAAVR